MSPSLTVAYEDVVVVVVVVGVGEDEGRETCVSSCILGNQTTSPSADAAGKKPR